MSHSWQIVTFKMNDHNYNNWTAYYFIVNQLSHVYRESEKLQKLELNP